MCDRDFSELNVSESDVSESDVSESDVSDLATLVLHEQRSAR
jgi:hypothetical protein